MRYESSPYAEAGAAKNAGEFLKDAAQKDVGVLNALSAFPCDEIHRAVCGAAGGAQLPQWEAGPVISFDELTSFYQENGFGVFAQSRALFWSGGDLTAILHPDEICEEAMVGYESQRREVYKNTRALLTDTESTIFSCMATAAPENPPR